MTKQLEEIGTRLKGLREDCDFSAEQMAEKLEIPIEEYIKYETGDVDFSFSFLYNAASILGVDVVDLMSGESPQLSNCTVVRKGKGYRVNRYQSYDYKHLAFTFRNKKAEPFLVRIEPKKETPAMHAHDGQEFNYIVSGKIKFYIDEISYELEEGDSVYFDSSRPHAEKALGEDPAEFIAVVVK